MEMFKWVDDAVSVLMENGEHRLARIMDDLPSVVLDGASDEVERLADEGLSLARSVENKWIEVYLRHWRLQSRVLHQLDASRDTLKEAVGLVDFASREDTRDCPQSVCTTQDLAACYGCIDGPGYVEERIAAADETLARISPKWPCFRCISGEKLGALLDGRRFEEACALGASQRKAGNAGDELLAYCCALLAMSKPTEALATAEAFDAAGHGVSGVTHKRVLRTLCLIRLERYEEAAQALPSSELLHPAIYVNWLRCVREIFAHAPQQNTWELELVVAEMVCTLKANESHYTLAKVRLMAAQLACLRKARSTAEYHLEAAQVAMGALRVPGRIESGIGTLKEKLAKLPAPETTLPEDVDKFLESLGADPESDLAPMAEASKKWPNSVELVMNRAAAFDALGRGDERHTLIEQAYRESGEDVVFFMPLVESLLHASKHEDVFSLAESVREKFPVPAGVARARSYSIQRKLSEAAAELDEILHLDPEQTGWMRKTLTSLRRELGDSEEALRLLNESISAEDDEGLHWDRMLVASQVGSWFEVRESAAELGMELQGEEGPIEEEWEACLLQMESPSGTEQWALAQRTGPVSARVFSLASPRETQYVRDVWLFDAMALNGQEVASAEGDEEPPLLQYKAVQRVSEGGFRTYAIDGLHPGDDVLEQFLGELEERGVLSNILSDESYEVQDEGDSESSPLPAVYIALACPENMGALELHESLEQLTKGCTLLWRELAGELNDEEIIETQKEIGQRYGI